MTRRIECTTCGKLRHPGDVCQCWPKHNYAVENPFVSPKERYLPDSSKLSFLSSENLREISSALEFSSIAGALELSHLCTLEANRLEFKKAKRSLPKSLHLEHSKKYSWSLVITYEDGEQTYIGFKMSRNEASSRIVSLAKTLDFTLSEDMMHAS